MHSRKAALKNLKGLVFFAELEHIKTRRAGKSTGQALEAIGYALTHPGAVVKVADHHGTSQAHKHLLETCFALIQKLELKGFKFNKTKNTFTYSLDW